MRLGIHMRPWARRQIAGVISLVGIGHRKYAPSDICAATAWSTSTAPNALYSEGCNVRFWHLADICAASENVRFRG